MENNENRASPFSRVGGMPSNSMGKLLHDAIKAAGGDPLDFYDPLSMVAISIKQSAVYAGDCFEETCVKHGLLVFPEHLAIVRTVAIVAALSGACQGLDIAAALAGKGKMDLGEKGADALGALADGIGAMVGSIVLEPPGGDAGEPPADGSGG